MLDGCSATWSELSVGVAATSAVLSWPSLDPMGTILEVSLGASKTVTDVQEKKLDTVGDNLS